MLLFSAVVVLGIVTTMRWGSERWPRFLSAEVHRTISLLSVVFLVVHILTAILDPFTHLGLAAALVPLASTYRPVWVGLGVVSIYLGLAVLVTSLVRDRIGVAACGGRSTGWPTRPWPLGPAPFDRVRQRQPRAVDAGGRRSVRVAGLRSRWPGGS